MLTKYDIDSLGLLYLGFNKPIIDPPLMRFRDAKNG